MSEIGIGSTVFVKHDYRNEWRERQIVGETRVSWIIGDAARAWANSKVPKKADRWGRRFAKDRGGNGSQIAISREELDGILYVSEHRRGIERVVGCCEDAAVLRQIAALVNYDPEAGK